MMKVQHEYDDSTSSEESSIGEGNNAVKNFERVPSYQKAFSEDDEDSIASAPEQVENIVIDIDEGAFQIGASPMKEKTNARRESCSSIKDILAMTSLKERPFETSSCEEEYTFSSDEEESYTEEVLNIPCTASENEIMNSMKKTDSVINIRKQRRTSKKKGGGCLKRNPKEKQEQEIVNSLTQIDSTNNMKGSSRVVKSTNRSNAMPQRRRKFPARMLNSSDGDLQEIDNILAQTDSTNHMKGCKRVVKTKNKVKPIQRQESMDTISSEKVDALLCHSDSKPHISKQGHRVVKSSAKHQQTNKNTCMTKNQEAMLENNLMKGDSMNYMTNGENARKAKTMNRKSQLKNDDLMARFLKTHPNKHANDEVPNKNDSFGTQPLIK